MKPFVHVTAIVAIAICTASIFHASVIDAGASPDAANAFASTLTVHGRLQAAPSNENTASPFASEHPFEQALYSNAYYAQYHVALGHADLTAPDHVAPSADADGHPLWFDGSSGVFELERLVARVINAKEFDETDRL